MASAAGSQYSANDDDEPDWGSDCEYWRQCRILNLGLALQLSAENGSRFTPSQAGTYAWGGVFSTTYWVDPKEQ